MYQIVFLDSKNSTALTPVVTDVKNKTINTDTENVNPTNTIQLPVSNKTVSLEDTKARADAVKNNTTAVPNKVEAKITQDNKGATAAQKIAKDSPIEAATLSNTTKSIKTKIMSK